jgi:ribonuclease J
MSSLRYVPLGGLGEVGMNMWALEWEDQVLVIDAGLMFPHEELPGVDLVLPDPSYLLDPRRRVLGVFLTHGHEDHIGGLPFLLQRLRVPIYGTALTLGLARPRLREHGVLATADLRVVRLGDQVRVGPFSVETVAVAHSIPDAAALVIDTPGGRVLYTSDFKLETDPPFGRGTDVARLRRAGDEGVALLLSDSTNSEREGRSGSERDLAPEFESIFQSAPGRIVVATFASNIHRVQLVLRLAAAHRRRVAIAGRSLANAFNTARELGVLEVPEGLTIQLGETAAEPRLVLLTAGSQGEPMSALSRFAARRHPAVNVRDGDWVVISARPIPGNERLVHRTIDNLYRNGAERVFYSEVGKVHVSGHAYRDELRELIGMVRPRFFIPVHGAYRQLHHHARLAVEAGVPEENVLLVEDGRVVELNGEAIRMTDENVAGLVFVDGLGIGDVEQVVLRDRRHLAEDGLLIVTLGISRASGEIEAGPELVTRGFIDPHLSEDLMREVRDEVLKAVGSAGPRPEPSLLQESVHHAVSRLVWKRTRRRPMVIPLVTGL